MSAAIEVAYYLRWILGIGAVVTVLILAVAAAAERHIADAFHGANVAYGPDLRDMDERVMRAALGEEL